MKRLNIAHVRVFGIAFAAATFLAGNLAIAQSPSITKAERVGMSSERLGRIHEIMQRHIDAGRITGAVTAVARRGQLVHFEAHGYSDPLTKKPMNTDAMFR